MQSYKRYDIWTISRGLFSFFICSFYFINHCILQKHQLKVRAAHQYVAPTVNVVKLTTRPCAPVYQHIWEYRQLVARNVWWMQSARKTKLVWTRNVWTLASEHVACAPRAKLSTTIRFAHAQHLIRVIRLWSADLYQVNIVHNYTNLLNGKLVIWKDFLQNIVYFNF